MHRKSYIKMDESLEIESILKDFDIRYCIIFVKRKIANGLHQLQMEDQN